MKRSVVSGYAGDEWREVADTTWPSVESYARKWGCEFTGYAMPSIKRCPPWRKLICIADALAKADQVLWVDCDVMVVDDSESIFSTVPDSVDHAACLLSDGSGSEHYNTGVWVVFRSMLPYIVAAAMDDDCADHPWWEQMAINKIIASGAAKTHRLSEQWNFWEGSPPETRQRFRHACGIRERDARLSFLRGGKG
jgi:hypothetical protein